MARSVEEEFLEWLDEQVETYTAYLTSGKVEDFSDYKRVCGAIGQCYRAKTEFKDVMNRYRRANE